MKHSKRVSVVHADHSRDFPRIYDGIDNLIG